MLAKDQVINTYRALNNWRSFRLKLFIEGIIIGILSGLIISFFRWSLHLVETNREHIYTFLKNTDWYWTAFWFIALAVIAFTLDRLTKYEPLAAGSGIPQVKGAILGFIKMRWLRILWVKLLAGIIGIGAGLSLGREGPSIQLGAVTAQGLSRLLKRTRLEERYLLTSGASAGLAAAFNAPLAGVIFALEELHRNFSVVVLLPAMAAAMTATVISRFILLCIQPHQNQRRNHIADGDQKTVNQVRPRFGQRGRVRHSSGAWISSGCGLKTENICLKQSAVSGSLYLVLNFTIIPNSQI